MIAGRPLSDPYSPFGTTLIRRYRDTKKTNYKLIYIHNYE
jgi:hypothetical protein